MRFYFWLVLGCLVLTPLASASVITVDTTDDEVAPNGNCSLRDAVRAAVFNVPRDTCAAGGLNDEIVFAPSLNGQTITLVNSTISSAHLVLAGSGIGIGSISIDGGGVTIEGSTSRDIFLLSNGTFILNNVHLVGGRWGLYVETASDLTISGSSITHGSRGGLYATSPSGINGRIAINYSTFSDNGTGHPMPVGGVTVDGFGEVSLLNSSLIRNVANFGGGLFTYHVNTKVINSTISENTALGCGGGAWFRPEVGQVIQLTGVTISANSASVNGGGVSYTSSSCGTAFVPGVGSLQLKNMVIGGNNAGSLGPDCYGSPTSEGNNLIESTSDCAITMQATDLFGVRPMLNNLGRNGGQTATMETMLPDASSPVIDAGDPTACALFRYDQRGPGFDRSVDGTGQGSAVCDIGAVEFVP